MSQPNTEDISRRDGSRSSAQLGFLVAHLRDPARQKPLGDSVLMMAAAELERLHAELLALETHVSYWRRVGIDDAALARASAALRA